jgi:hypothetical protein
MSVKTAFPVLSVIIALLVALTVLNGGEDNELSAERYQQGLLEAHGSGRPAPGSPEAAAMAASAGTGESSLIPPEGLVAVASSSIGPAPEAGDNGIAGPAPEAGDPGVVGPAPEDEGAITEHIVPET